MSQIAPSSTSKRTLDSYFCIPTQISNERKNSRRKQRFAEWETEDGFVFSAFKIAKDNQPIIRFYQTASEPKLLTTERPWQKSTILEETTGDAKKQFTASPNEIITLKGV